MSADFNEHPLTREAADVLQTAGYRVGVAVLPQTEHAVLVAENVYAVAAIIGVDEWAAVANVIDSLTTDFVNWALSRQPQAKQWDLYLCLLIAQPISRDEDLAEVERFTDDTRYIRRLVRNGVASEHAPGVRAALSVLLPLRLPDRIANRDPYRALIDALRGRGVDGDLAAQTVERFRSEAG
jgi:hypothetical protein